MGKGHSVEMAVGASAPSLIEGEATGTRKKGLALIAKVDVRPIPVAEIGLTERIRVDEGDIEDLAANIAEHGLINPITVMQQESGGYMLISGYRRLKACQMLGCDAVSSTVLSAVDAEERLRLEISENEQRKDFTVSEKLEYASKIRMVEEEKARQRMSWRQNQETQKDGRVARPTHKNEDTKGRTRDAVAKSVGLGSGRQLERAEYLAKNRPDLLRKVDNGEATIYGAYNAARGDTSTADSQPAHLGEEEPSVDYTPPVNSQAPVYVGAEHPELWKLLEAYNPCLEKVSGTGIKGANHVKLMENHIYATLYEKYQEAFRSANIMVGSYEKAKNGFEIQLSGMVSNLDAVMRERDELRQESEKLKQDISLAEKTGETYHQERDELRKVLEAYRKENERLQQELQNTRAEGRKRK